MKRPWPFAHSPLRRNGRRSGGSHAVRDALCIFLLRLRRPSDEDSCAHQAYARSKTHAQNAWPNSQNDRQLAVLTSGQRLPGETAETAKDRGKLTRILRFDDRNSSFAFYLLFPLVSLSPGRVFLLAPFLLFFFGRGQIRRFIAVPKRKWGTRGIEP